MSPSPRVSVVMPVYNGERYVRSAVESILAQTLANFEFIIVDDGSSDASLEILRSYQDARIRLIPVSHRGLAGALNAGLAAAQGEYVARMDADDICAPIRLQVQIDYMSSHPECVMAGTWGFRIDSADVARELIKVPVEDENIRQVLFANVPFIHGSVMMRREAVVRLGGYQESLASAEDYDLWLRLHEIGELANIPQMLYSLRMHGDSKTAREGIGTLRAGVYVRRLGTQRARGRTDALGRSPMLPQGFDSPRVWPPSRRQAALARKHWATSGLTRGAAWDAWRHAAVSLTLEPRDRESWGVLANSLAAMLGRPKKVSPDDSVRRKPMP